MPVELTAIEHDALDLLLAHRGEDFEILRQQLQAATFTSRRLSGVGVSVDIAVPRSLPGVFGDARRVLSGVVIATPSNPAWGEFILFVDGGYLAMLEGYAFDDAWLTESSEYTLVRKEPPTR
ncbi:MAG: hypothetical protein AAF138_09035 [Planctomycetota bacterium]